MTERTKTAIFMMGLPASGKSTYARQHFAARRFLDCDAIKARHPEYDPKNPAALHAWSKQKLEVEFAQTLLEGVDFVFDGTGTQFAPLIEKIREAQLNRYRTKLIYVTVPLGISLKRNAARERRVPESIIIEKADAVSIAFEVVSREVDEVQVIDNSVENTES